MSSNFFQISSKLKKKLILFKFHPDFLQTINILQISSKFSQKNVRILTLLISILEYGASVLAWQDGGRLHTSYVWLGLLELLQALGYALKFGMMAEPLYPGVRISELVRDLCKYFRRTDAGGMSRAGRTNSNGGLHRRAFPFWKQ